MKSPLDALFGLAVALLHKSDFSRRPQSVKTAGIIRPRWIAEIHCTVGEGHGLKRRPNGAGQVSGGFYNDRDIRRASDVDPELIAPHAKAGVFGLHLGIPEHAGKTGKRRPPARSARKIIDRYVVVSGEHGRTRTGGVALEIHSCQAVAGAECLIPNACNGGADRDVGQVSAVEERIPTDVGNAVANRDSRQVGAAVERPVPDASDAVGDCDTRQACAPKERPVSEADDAVRNRYAGQAVAVLERTSPDAGDALRNHDTGEGAGPKGFGRYAGDAVGNG